MRSSVRVAAPLAVLLLAGCGAAGSPVVVGGPVVTPDTSAPSSSSSPVSTSASPSRAVAGLRPCRAGDVRVERQPDGATGQSLLVVRVVARPGVRCRLGGFPRVRAVTDGPRVPVAHDPYVSSGVSTEPFALEDGTPSVFVLGWRMGRWCAPPVRIDRFDVVMPGGGAVAVQGFGSAACDTATFPDEHSGVPVTVSRFLPEQ